MRRAQQSTIRILVLGLAVWAGGATKAARAERSYRDPVAVPVDGELYLFVRERGAAEELCACYRERQHGGWQKITELRADYNHITEYDGHFYLFLDETVIQLAVKDGAKTGQVRWPYNWGVQGFDARDGVIAVYGVGSEGRLFTASGRLAARPASRATTAPAAAGAVPGFLAPPGWGRDRAIAGSGEGRAVSLETIRVGDALWLFWTTGDERGGHQGLRAGVLGPDGLGEVAEIARRDGRIEFAAAALGGRLMVVYAELPAELRGTRRPLHRWRGDGRWLPFDKITSAENPYGEETVALRAATVRGRVHLLMGTEYPMLFLKPQSRVLQTVYADGSWGRVEPVLADPRFNAMLEYAGLLSALMVVALGALALSVIRSRFLPRRASIGGVEYRLAPWLRRGAAYACDLAVVVLVVNLGCLLLGLEPSEPRLMVGIFCVELVYFGVLECRAGRTPGKRLLGVLVVSRNGGYPTWSEALLRNLPRAFVDSLIVTPFLITPLGWVVGSIILLNTPGSRRAGDLAAGTYVVRERTNSQER
jgi:uncharacterized RDD family membrane protein YckC